MLIENQLPPYICGASSFFKLRKDFFLPSETLLLERPSCVENRQAYTNDRYSEHIQYVQADERLNVKEFFEDTDRSHSSVGGLRHVHARLTLNGLEAQRSTLTFFLIILPQYWVLLPTSNYVYELFFNKNQVKIMPGWHQIVRVR